MLNSFQVILNTKILSTELTITNTDNKPFSFSTALHSYFHVSIIFRAQEIHLSFWCNQNKISF